MNYKIFKPSLIGEFQDKLNQEEMSFIELYKNQEEFLYSFEDSDILESNIPIQNDKLGAEMLEAFQNHKDDQQTADFECAKILYENLKLTPVQAGNVDFWNYLHHFDMYKYIHQRWKNQDSLQTHIERHWLMNHSSQKHLISFPLTTLWWSIHLTIDEAREDKYELSKVYFSNNRFRTVSLGGMSFVRHKPAVLGVLEFMKTHKKELTKTISYTDLGDEISKFINLLGGTKPLSFFEKDWFMKKLESRFQTGKKPAIEVDHAQEGITDFVSEPDEIEVADRDEESLLIKSVSLFKNGNCYFYENQFKEDAPFKIKIYEGNLKAGKVLYFYDNYKINQVEASAFLKNRESYNNCLHNLTEGVKLTELTVINSEKLIGILQKINHIWHIKFIKTSLLKENNSNLRANGYTVGCNNIDSIQEYRTKIIPFSLANQLDGAIIPDGLRTKGVQLNGSTFSEYRDDVLPLWSELKKML